MAKSQKLGITIADKDAEQQELPFTGHSLGMQNDTATLEDNLAVSSKLNLIIPHYPAIALPAIHHKLTQKHMPTKKTCTQIPTVALFIITKIWKKQRRPSVGAWTTNSDTPIHWNTFQ